MKTRQISTPKGKSPFESVRDVLTPHNMTLREFAQKHQFEFETVKTAVQRHWGKPAANPWGKKTRTILRCLESYQRQPDPKEIPWNQEAQHGHDHHQP